ncbi:hypothetical protein FRC10_006299 [Ceratobasidium sp. 414]|nr:hypothetical protein FRC10_006299 [Ceratobasidium sp. 414]
MSSLPTRGSRATKQHQRKPYERPPPSPAPQLTRTKSGFFNAVKALVSAPLSWLAGADTSNTAASNGAAGEGRHLKRRASRNRVDNGEGSRPKRMRTISPPRVSKSASGYLDPPEQMLRHTISAATFARAGGFKPSFPSDASGDFTQQARASIRDTPLQYSSLHRPQSPSRRTPSVGPWFPQPASTRNSLAPRPSQVHFGALPNLNIDAAIASHDDSKMMSPSPSVSVGVGLGRERTPSMALPNRESSVALNRVSVSRATGAPLRVSLSASNPFASLGKSSSVAPERKKPTLVWDDTLGVTSASDAETKADTPAPSAKNTAERLLNALENMHTHTGDAQRPRRRPPPSVQVPSPLPSVPNKLKRMIQPYGEVKVSPKAKGKGAQRRPINGLMKMLMKNKKESETEDMDVEESPKPTESTKPTETVPQPPAEAEKVATKDKAADKAADVDMDSTSTPALKIIDNFRPASQPPSRPGTSSSLRQSKTITKRAHVPSAGRNRFSANNDDAEEEDEEAIERRNAELVAAANASVFKVPEGFKFGGSVTPAPAPKPAEFAKPNSMMDVISPKPVPGKSMPTPVLSFTPIAVPRADNPPPKSAFFGESTGSKSEIPKVQNPFAGLGAGFSKPEIKVPEVPKWGGAPAPSAPAVAKSGEGVSVFANIGVLPSDGGSGPVAPTFSFGKPAETAPVPAPVPEKSNEPAKPLFGVATGSGFSFGEPTPTPTTAPAAAADASANPFAGIGASNKSTASAPALPFSLGASKPEGTLAFSFGQPLIPEKPKAPKPVVEISKPVVEAPKPSTSPFSFAPAQPAEKPAASSPAPSFSFGASPAPAPVSTPTPTPVTPALAPVSAPTPAPAASLAPPAFSFGAPPTSTPVIAAPTPKPAASPFSFGTPAPTPSTSSPAPAVPEPPKKSPFDFSAPVAPVPAQPEAPKKSPFDFTPAPAPTTSKSPFDFASSAKSVEKPASPFAFGAPTPAPAPVPVPGATEKKSPFDFSSIPKPASAGFTFGAPAPAAPAAPVTNGFTFGAPAPPRPSTPPSGGDAAMEESPSREPAKIVTSGFANSSGFGAQPPSSGFAFGTNTNGSGASSTGPFGSLLNTGSAPQTNGFGASAAPASPAPFAFGASNGTGSGFGSNGFNTNGNAMPASTSGFTFGTGGFPQPASATASPSNPFTQPTTSAPFGQPNPPPSNAFTTPASPFPVASPALSAVGFNTNPAPSNAFGLGQPATNGPATQPSFTFGAGAPTAGAASPSTFTFGLPAGGAPSPATPTATSSPFVFGQAAEQGSPAAGVQFNLGTADASPGGRKIKPLRRPRRN